jgi:opacity protein-like surface antigen
MRICYLLAVSLVIVLVPRVVHGQTATSAGLTREVFGSIGAGHLFRFNDQTFGDELNLGAGFGVRGSRLGVEFEVNRLFGLTPGPAPCGIASCSGEGREGVMSATIASANLLYYLSSSRIQPYVSGGLGGLWSESVHSTLTVVGNSGTITEQTDRDAGLALNFGGGVRIGLHKSFSIRPEVRFYSSTAHSRENLSMIRTSIGAVFHW